MHSPANGSYYIDSRREPERRRAELPSAPNIAAAGEQLARLTATSALAAAAGRRLGEGAVRAAAESRTRPGDGVWAAREARHARFRAGARHQPEHRAHGRGQALASGALRVATRSDQVARAGRCGAARARLRGRAAGHAARPHGRAAGAGARPASALAAPACLLQQLRLVLSAGRRIRVSLSLVS